MAWATQLLRAAGARLAAKVHKRVKESATDRLFEPDDGRWSSISKSHANFTDAEKYLDYHAWVEQKRSARSQGPRDAQYAFAFMRAFNLPEPLRPHYSERRWIHRIIEERPEACWHAAASQLIAVGGVVNRQVDDVVDNRIAALWDDYSPAQLARLVLKDERAAPLLGRVYTADFIRPSVAATKKFISSVARMAKSHNDKPDLREAARALIEVEFSTEPLNPSAQKSTLEQRQVVQKDYVEAAPELFSAAAQAYGHPLGTDADQVYSALCRMAAPITHELTVGEG